MNAIALISGSLDSLLAAKVVADTGVVVIGVHFQHPFYSREEERQQRWQELAQMLAAHAHIELRRVGLSAEFMATFENSLRGYGSNPPFCKNCRVLMLKKAKEIMEEEKAAFLITGDVVGRKSSQQQNRFYGIDRAAGVEGIVLRPLSAKLLEETVAEKNGWVDRQQLYAYSGRSQKPQIDLAVMRGIIDYPDASGCCLLTESRFADRVRDLSTHGQVTLDDIELIKVGRHFRVGDTAKLVVGRNEQENMRIERLAGGDDLILLPPEDVAGPVGLCRGACADVHLQVMATIMCRYCDRQGRDWLEFSCRSKYAPDTRTIRALPATEEEMERVRV